MQGATGQSKEATRLRDRLEMATEKHDRASMADVLDKLTELEPAEARWPHRLGETLARLGRGEAAEEAYAKASAIYASQGFLARAIAVAKLAVELNPARVELLSQLETEPARSLRHGLRKAITPPASPTTAVPILELESDVLEDELVFDDAPDSCTIEVQEIDFDASMLAELGAEEARDGASPDAERLARMRAAALFADIPEAALLRIAHDSERVAFPDGATLFARGEPANALIVVVEGHALVHVEGLSPIEANEGDILGETTVLADGIRSADVTARGELVALRLRKGVLDDVILEHPAVGDVLFGLLARRLVADAVATTPLFQPFDPATRAEIARAFEVRRARAGTVLQEKGKKSDALYLLLSGTAESGDDGSAPLRYGALLGHEMLVMRAPAPRTVTTTTEAVLLRLPATRFAMFVTEYPPALAHLVELAESSSS